MQRYILAVLFYSLGGSAWKDNRGWLSSESECTWKHITCNNKNEVTMLWLKNNNLIGTLPHELAFIYSLDTLVIHDNKVSGIFPPIYFHQLYYLRQISVYNNDMTGTIPEAINK